MDQLTHFYRAQLSVAAQNHERMAEMQAAAGNHRLAADSRRTAQARRIASANVTSPASVKEALDYGEFGAATLAANGA